jgi:hypothetical protein
VPFSKKAINEINWVGVPHASKYEIYRVLVPRPKAEDMSMIQSKAPGVFNNLFNPGVINNIYFTEPGKLKKPLPGMKDFSGFSGSAVNKAAAGALPAAGDKNAAAKNAAGVKTSRGSTADAGNRILAGNQAATSGTSVKKVSDAVLAAESGKFKTLRLKDKAVVMSDIKNASLSDRLKVYTGILDKYGPLAVAPFDALDESALEALAWFKIGELTIPQGEESTGELQFYDKKAVFGETYLYKVQAWNDDNLGSERSEEVSVFTRKGDPFPPVTGLKWSNSGGKPLLSWNPAKEANLSVTESREYVAGYIVYRSNTKDGDYYQASGLIMDNAASFLDVNASLTANNWYKVKVVDTAGYISDFSGAVLAKVEPVRSIPEGSFRKVTPVKNIRTDSSSAGKTLNTTGANKLNRSLPPYGPYAAVRTTLPTTR